jgi:hypothetical protein
MTTKEAIEANLPNSFTILHKKISQILKENNVLPEQKEEKGDQLKLIVETVMKLQRSLIVQNTLN